MREHGFLRPSFLRPSRRSALCWLWPSPLRPRRRLRRTHRRRTQQRYNPRELREAAKGGDADAQYNLGRMHIEGYGVTKSVEAAVKWFRAAAEQGHAGAQYELGVIYDSGGRRRRRQC
ncbi:MAG: tetratricopeptide repeat protein [Rhodospirillales bacterium]